MVAVICRIALAVSSILLARLVPVTSISAVFAPIERIASAIFPIVSLKYRAISVSSSFPFTGSETVKSPVPCAISFSASAVFCSDLEIPSETPKIIQTTKVTNTVSIMMISLMATMYF